MKKFLRKTREWFLRPVTSGLDSIRFQQGQLLVDSMKRRDARSVRDAEFKVFSQWGEDGIIQWLISRIPDVNQTFIEFGVEDYTESNTRFLLMHDNWRGLVIDGSQANISQIGKAYYYWRHDLKAVCAFITRDNVNDLFRDNGFEGEIGLLSVDIDGNDYRVSEAVEAVRPQIVVTEYNSVFGPDKMVTIPYEADFTRGRAHFSGLYWGASFAAFKNLWEGRGYFCVGSNSAGNNLFLVRNDYQQFFDGCDKGGYVESRYRESKGPDGALTWLTGGDRLRAIKDMTVYEIHGGGGGGEQP